MSTAELQTTVSDRMNAATLFRIVNRLVNQGYAQAEWEIPPPDQPQRPYRRFSLTPKGRDRARAEILGEVKVGPGTHSGSVSA